MGKKVNFTSELVRVITFRLTKKRKENSRKKRKERERERRKIERKKEESKGLRETVL